ncbi:MAG: cytochrome-c oxidase, cbb3-type subunit III [Chromatiales bacterium]|nr:cytochrome-c oxidase, cbb3-type subunit III [Chromatiales bacterium]
MTSGWSWFIAIVALANVAGAVWLLLANGRAAAGDVAANKTTHVWDQDLTELNNPLPRWWFWLFILTVIWGLGYLVLYPGLGAWQGTLGWSQAKQHATEVHAARELQAPRYLRFATMSLDQLARDPDAMGEARSLFANGCAGCHGSDARGAPGFPNLTDNDWLYGNAPETLVATIGAGRLGIMPGWQAVLTDAGVDEVIAYLQSLSSTPANPGLVAAGATRYATFCVACHGVDARGNQVLGAPNLADTIWLYGGDTGSLRTSIAVGRQNQMPAHEALLGPDRVRLLAAYVLSLGQAAEGGGSNGPAGGG